MDAQRVPAFLLSAEATKANFPTKNDNIKQVVSFGTAFAETEMNYCVWLPQPLQCCYNIGPFQCVSFHELTWGRFINFPRYNVIYLIVDRKGTRSFHFVEWRLRYRPVTLSPQEIVFNLFKSERILNFLYMRRVLVGKSHLNNAYILRGCSYLFCSFFLF